MQTFNLDLSAKRVIPLLYAKQRDVGTKILVNITDNGEDYTIPDDVIWSVWYSGASGEGNYSHINNESACLVGGNTVTVELIYQMLNNPGEHLMCLVMNSSDGTQLGLWNIPYFVEAIPGADSKAAQEYYQAFLAAQAAAEAAATRSEEAADRAEAGALKVDEHIEWIDIQKYEIGTYAAQASNAQYQASQSAARAEEAAERADAAESSGIYVGSGEMPEGYNVQIDPDGEPVDLHQEIEQAVSEAVAQKMDKSYELIETITLEEEVSEIIRTQEPNGTPYSFAGCILRATIPPAADKSNNAIVRYCIGPGRELISYMLNPVSATATMYGFSRLWTDHGRWLTGWWKCVGGHGEFSAYYENPYYQGAHTLEHGYLYRLVIQFASQLPVGTTIEIWGVRADA